VKLTLERIATDGASTIGILFLDGIFQCFTLEDEYRTVKIQGETRIPAGTHRIGLRNDGGLTQKYAARFPKIHKVMLWLRDVRCFEYIYIHVGNRDEDSEGCILVGDTAVTSDDDMMVGASRAAYRRIYPVLAAAAAAGDLEITIKDRDR
jgi:hypothetical protein